MKKSTNSSVNRKITNYSTALSYLVESIQENYIIKPIQIVVLYRVALILFVNLSCGIMKAQDNNCNCIDDKGIIIGYNNTGYSISKPSVDAGQYDNSGFLIGFFADVELSDKFSVQPEFLYTMSFSEGVDFNTVTIPLAFKYYINEAISIQVGPMFDVILDRTFIGNSGINLMGGIGVDLTDNFSITARYSKSITNRTNTYSDKVINYDFNYLQIGFALKLWKKPSEKEKEISKNKT